MTPPPSERRRSGRATVRIVVSRRTMKYPSESPTRRLARDTGIVTGATMLDSKRVVGDHHSRAARLTPPPEAANVAFGRTEGAGQRGVPAAADVSGRGGRGNHHRRGDRGGAGSLVGLGAGTGAGAVAR